MSGESTVILMVALVVSTILMELMAGMVDWYGISGTVMDWLGNLYCCLLLDRLMVVCPGITLIGHMMEYLTH